MMTRGCLRHVFLIDNTRCLQAKAAEWEVLVASADKAKTEAASLEAQNQRLGDELDRLAEATGAKGTSGGQASAAELTAAVKA